MACLHLKLCSLCMVLVPDAAEYFVVDCRKFKIYFPKHSLERFPKKYFDASFQDSFLQRYKRKPQNKGVSIVSPKSNFLIRFRNGCRDTLLPFELISRADFYCHRKTITDQCISFKEAFRARKNDLIRIFNKTKSATRIRQQQL